MGRTKIAIYKFSPNGDLICSYNGWDDAAKKMNTPIYNLKNAANHKIPFNGYYFSSNQNYVPIVKERGKHYPSKRLFVFDTEGFRIGAFNSIREGASKLGLNYSAVKASTLRGARHDKYFFSTNSKFKVPQEKRANPYLTDMEIEESIISDDKI